MLVACLRRATLWSALIALLAFSALPTAAQDVAHLGTNQLIFEPVGNSAFPDATGKGIVDYRGGDQESSRWRASFRFSGLEANATYTVVIKDRFADSDTADETSVSPLCSFQTDGEGKGNCFWYFRGLVRLNVVQLRTKDETGRRVLQASRSGDPGSITTDPNRYSPGGQIPVRQQSRNG